MAREVSISRRGFVSAGLAAAATVGLPVQAQAKARTYVLVHGAWHGGWCWRRVGDRLRAKGYYVVAPTLSGVGERSHLKAEDIDLMTHVEDVVGEMKWKDLGDVVLVGHSYGGLVITGVAEQMHERIAAIVYLDAFIPGDGQSLADLVDHKGVWPEPVIPPHPAAYFHVNDKDAAWVSSKLTGQPTQCFTEKLKVTEAYQSIPKKLYVRAPMFASKPFDDALGRCRADKSWQTATVTCGHDVMIDQPAELTAMLERFA